MSRTRVLVYSVLFAALIWPCIIGRAAPLGTAFTYQGRLNDGGNPANGTYDLTFALFDDRGAGSQIGDPVTNANVAISNGVFSVELDFTAKPFDGTALWLEVGVRSVSGLGTFERLSPRQPVTPVPYALQAVNATTAASADAAALATNATTAATATAVPWSGITSRPGGLDDGDNDTLYSNGAGLTLVGTQFSLDTALTDTLYWKLGGNAGTTPGVNFVGTADNQALELKANNARVLRLEPNATSPNVIGGNPDNSVIAGVYGATIGGGGSSLYPNEASANYATVGGGRGNRIRGNAEFTTIAGGRFNLINTNADSATIGGGYNNQIGTNNIYGTVAGGYDNVIGGGAASATIGGGYGNDIQANSAYGTISGGQKNYIQSNNSHATIGGGTNNVIQSDADFGTIGGGGLNVIQANADYATISGGWSNVIQVANVGGTIGGGIGNVIQSNTVSATIAGGYTNLIQLDTDYSTVGGGYRNIIETNADYSTIAGGAQNIIFPLNTHSAIGGGSWNYVRSNTTAGTIGGGVNNVIYTNADYATIPGGQGAAAESYGQMAYASGVFSGYGDAQSSLYVLRRITTSAALTELFLDGTTATRRMKIPSESTWAFDILVVGRGTAANVSCGYQIRGVIENNAGTLVFVPNPGPAMTVLGEDNPATTATVAADSVNDALSVRVVGIAGVTMRWVATVRTVQIKY